MRYDAVLEKKSDDTDSHLENVVRQLAYRPTIRYEKLE